MNLNRIPMPEPQQFKGDPLKYPGWRAAFETLISASSLPPAKRVHYLRRYLGGPAQEAVEGFLLLSTDEAYDDAMRLLETRYGNHFAIANAFRDKLETWPKISNRDGLGLQKLADFLKQCQSAMVNNPSLAILNDERENRRILLKLPEWIVTRWGRFVHRVKKDTGRFPPFGTFVEFLTEEAELATDPVTSLSAIAPVSVTPIEKRRGPRREASALNTRSEEATENQFECIHCQSKSHDLDQCVKFTNLSADEKQKFIMRNGLCFGCLLHGHRSKDCRNRSVCSVCKKRHPTCLHRLDAAKNTPPTKEQEEDAQEATAHQTRTHSVSSAPGAMSTMILPVRILHKDLPTREIHVYAILDAQSDTTFISEEIYEALGIKGTDTKLLLSTLSVENEPVRSRKVSGLVVRGIDSPDQIHLPVSYTRETIPMDRRHIPGPETAKGWPHLRHIAEEIHKVSDYPVGLLIGYNCTRALAPREVIANDSGPFAQRTDLGWGIVGASGPMSS